MNRLNYVFLFLYILYNTQIYSRENELNFNFDVFNCRENIKLLYEVEVLEHLYPQDVDKVDLGGISFEDKFNLLANELSGVSPVRSRFLQHIYQKKRNIIWKNGEVILRKSPPSNLIMPSNCRIDALALVHVDSVQFQIVIDQDLYDRLSINSQVLFWFNLSLDIERAIFDVRNANFPIDDPIYDPILGRQFMACWQNKDCHPKELSTMHQIALDPNFRLPYLEQDGIVVPADLHAFTINKTNGLIESVNRIVDVYYDEFNSYVKFGIDLYPLSHFSLQNSFIRFHNSGKVECAPIKNSFQRKGVYAKVFDQHVFMESSSAPFPLGVPLCWNEDESIIQGQIYLEKNEKFNTKLFGRTYNLNFYEPYSGEYFGLGLTMYPKDVAENSVKWVFKFKGIIPFNGSEIEIQGPLKLAISGRPECFVFAEKTKIKLKNGTILKVNDSNVGEDLYCFDELDSYIVIPNIKWPYFIQKDLIYF